MHIIETKDLFTVAGPTTPGRPFLNENQFGAISTSSTFFSDKKTLMNWIKRTPEAIGILRQLSLDVVTRLNFISIEEKRSGRPSKNKGRDNVKKAELFARNNQLKNQLRAAVMEGVALGDAYLWKKNLSEGDKNIVIEKTLKEFGLKPEFKAFIDEDPVGEKGLQYVPSTTMFIELDKGGTKIDSFIQRTAFGTNIIGSSTATGKFDLNQGAGAGRVRRWKPKQIIHYKFMELDGKVHGFTPMQSNFPIIKTLGAIKQYHGNYFESGILADIFFNFEEMDPNSPAFERMRQVIQEWYNNKRRGHEITTGKFKIEKINEWNKDMEFRMLSIYYTGVMAFSVGMPLEKIRAILGGEIKSTTGGSDISNTDYQRTIFDMQEDFENLMNTQFFNEEFGVDMKFDRSASRDELAEIQVIQQKINVLEKIKQMDLINKDNLVSFTEKLFPSFPSQWWNDNPEPEQMGPMIPSSSAIKGQASEALSEQKKQEQKPQQKNNPPTGIKEYSDIIATGKRK